MAQHRGNPNPVTNHSSLVTNHSLLITPFLAALLTLAACQQRDQTPAAPPAPAKVGGEASAQAQPVRGGTLYSHLRTNPATLDPHKSPGGVDREALWSIFDPLIALDVNGKPTKGGLLQDWTIAPDGLSITFKLRTGAKFHDGTPVDAEAVKFNVERVKNPDTKSPKRGDLAPVSSVEVVDNATVRFQLSRPSPSLVEKLGSWGGLVVSPTALRKGEEAFGRNPVGSGPFEFVEWLPDNRITLKRFEGYWQKGLPYLDQLVFQIIPDFSVSIANLKTGGLHIVRSLPEQDFQANKGLAGTAFTRLGGSLARGMMYNLGSPPLDNKLVRQAIAWAIDRDALSNRIMGEGGKPILGLVPQVSMAYDPNLRAYAPRNVARAKELLTQAGHPSGFSVKLLIPAQAPETLQAQVIQANLAEVGIRVEIDQVPRTRTLELMFEHNFQLALQALLQSNDADAPMTNYFRSGGGQNYMQYKVPQVDALVEKASTSYDEAERRRLYREAAAIILDDIPYLPLYVDLTADLFTDKVQNFKEYLDNFPRYTEVWLRR